ncbi:hypothetical protein V6N12_008711 [Hibiscus sabdariffa]|uniref:RING-CH-type domain-containing protein n=1 Tax=Hibiscus sabdariffa TaxID=183260 RepID=A0ABR2AIS4_9ROSI
MSDHVVLCVDRLTTPESLQPVQETEAEAAGSSGRDSSIVAEPVVCAIDVEDVEEHDSCDGEEPLLQTAECRICQDEDCIKNLEAPCSCSGSLKFAHRKCVQCWCDEKGDITCEICHQRLLQLISGKSHNLALETLIFLSFVINVGLVTAIETLISLGHFPVCSDLCPNLFGDLEWDVSGASLGYRRILAVTAERHILEPGYDEYSDNDSSGTEFVRAATLTVIALLFLRHALYLTSGEKEDDVSQYISLSLLHAAGFLLPCYVLAWAISILQRRREQEETAAVAAADSATAESAVMIQAVQPQAIHYSIAPAPEPSATQQQEPLQ